MNDQALEIEPLMPTTRRIRGESMLVFAIVFLLTFIAIHQYALMWDEGMNLQRQDTLAPWLGHLRRIVTFSPDRLVSLSDLFHVDILDRYWKFSKEEPDGHGPFYCLISLASHVLTAGFVSDPAAYRVGGIFLFSLTNAILYGTLRRRWSLFGAVTTICLFASIPRVLPEVCVALVDGPLYCLAILAWSFFVRSVEGNSKTAGVLFGIALGCAMATKFTGWVLIGPYAVWGVVVGFTRGERRPMWTAAAGFLIALATAIVINVGWWPELQYGLARFFRSNLTRKETIPITTMFLGERYAFSLPWYNTLVWTGVAMPIGTVIFGAIGIVLSLRCWIRRPFGLLLVGNWLLLMLIRAMPQAPGHDGTRQIIISFGFLALLAGYALERIYQWSLTHRAKFARGSIVVLGILAASESIVSAVRYHPLQLSYYSPAIGGLAGADKLGFEATYFFDSITPEVIDWLNQNTQDGGAVAFCNNTPTFKYLRDWRVFHFDYTIPTEPRAKWYVLQHRSGIYKPYDEWLIRRSKPAFQKKLFGVPLLTIYSIADWHSAYDSTEAARDNQEKPAEQ